jgi:hypothetical protein
MHTHTVWVWLKHGSPDFTEGCPTILPPALIQCREMWRDRGGRTSWRKDEWAFVRRSIEPLLYAAIDPENEHYEGGDLTGILDRASCEITAW